MDLFNSTGAIFSECRKYRYALWRVWEDSKPFVMFIGLNPSTANEETDDPTIRRVKRFAWDWGYGGVYMMNLFAWVTPDPFELKSVPDPIGKNNDWLKKISRSCNEVIFAWGSFDEAKARSKEVTVMFENSKALVINKDGSPRHPLYVRADTKPILFNSQIAH